MGRLLEIAKTGQRPLDAILYGKNYDENYGLALNKMYTTTVHVTRADHFGLPHQRKRLYISMVRTDVSTLAAISHLTDIIDRESVVRKGHLHEFLFLGPSEQAMVKELQHAGFGGRPSCGDLSLAAKEKFDDMRRKHRFPPRNSPQGQPYSRSLPPTRR